EVQSVRVRIYTAGTIVAQNPPPQKAMPGGGRMTLLVNRGERGETYVMPDLIGVNGDRARGRRSYLARGEPLMKLADSANERRLIQIAPSLLSADFARLGDAITLAERA